MDKSYLVCIPDAYVRRMADILTVGANRTWMMDGTQLLNDNPSVIRIQGPSAPCPVITLRVDSLKKHPDGDAVIAECTVTDIGEVNVAK